MIFVEPVQQLCLPSLIYWTQGLLWESKDGNYDSTIIFYVLTSCRQNIGLASYSQYGFKVSRWS